MKLPKSIVLKALKRKSALVDIGELEKLSFKINLECLLNISTQLDIF